MDNTEQILEDYNEETIYLQACQWELEQQIYKELAMMEGTVHIELPPVKKVDNEQVDFADKLPF